MKKVIRLTERDLTRLVKRVIKEQEDDDFDFGGESCDEDMVMALEFMLGITKILIDAMAEQARKKGVSLRELADESGEDLMSKVQEFGDRIDEIKDGTCGKDELMEIYEEMLETIENN